MHVINDANVYTDGRNFNNCTSVTQYTVHKNSALSHIPEPIHSNISINCKWIIQHSDKRMV